MRSEICICVIILLKLQAGWSTILKNSELDLSDQLKIFEPCFIRAIQAEVYGRVSYEKFYM